MKGNAELNGFADFLGRKLKLGRDLVVWFVKFFEGFVERHVLF
jgi:hypothetical protein